MTTITHTYDLPHGLYRGWLVADEAEAARIAAGREGYLYQSTIIPALYLWIKEIEKGLRDERIR